MIWVVAQAILFTLILFLPINATFELNSWVERALWFVSVLGWAVLLRAVYDLRHSLAVSPNPVRHGKLQTRGIYSYVRHPMYLAVWLIMGPLAITSGSLTKVILYLILVGFFVAKTRYEEQQLVKKYPAYKKYQTTVGAYFPKNR